MRRGCALQPRLPLHSGSARTGAVGPQGPQGNMGPQGLSGPGVPSGGAAGQVLKKVDGSNYNTVWSTQSLNVVSAFGQLVTIPPGQTRSVAASCPTGTVVVGGGYVATNANPEAIHVATNGPQGFDTWNADITNAAALNHTATMYAIARCISFT